MSFVNYSKRRNGENGIVVRHRQWSEEECRLMLNAALAYLCHQGGGQLVIPVKEMLAICEAGRGGIAMAMSDDDSILTITRMQQQ